MHNACIGTECKRTISVVRRYFRHHVTPGMLREETYTLDNTQSGRRWPLLRWTAQPSKTSLDRKALMFHIEQLEIERLQNIQPFQMPPIKPGDLVEVRYELSRTQQTQAVFQGYCVEIRKKGLDSSFLLKNSYDGIGVTQLVPRYSPRLLGVRVVRSALGTVSVDTKHQTKDYRYKWQYNVHHRSRKNRHTISTLHKPGIRSLEPRFKNRLRHIMQRYMLQRTAAGLPPYMPNIKRHLLDQNRRLEIRAEIHRRLMVHTAHEEERLRVREKAKRYKTRWGVYKICKPIANSALDALPAYHPLAVKNLDV